MSVGFLALGFLGTCLSWILLNYFGRRRIYIVGLAVLAVLQLLIGILDCAPNYKNRPSVIWAQSVLMLVWNFGYGLSLGPICFVILCEVSATRVRSKTIAVATAAQATIGKHQQINESGTCANTSTGIVMTVAIPYMINPDEGKRLHRIDLAT